MTSDNPFIQTIRLRNLLSYGPDSEEVELRSLNVLIGPNASGKSNLIEGIALLKAAPSNLADVIREGGPVNEWLWKGVASSPTAEIEMTVNFPHGYLGIPLRHRIAFTESGQRIEVVDEAIENAYSTDAREPDVYFFYRYQGGHPALNVMMPVDEEEETEVSGTGPDLSGSDADTGRRRGKRRLRREDIAADQSVLSQRKDPDLYPELGFLAKSYAAMMLYREWNVGRRTAPRKPQDASLPYDALLENGSNLGLVLNELQFRADSRKMLREALQQFNPSFSECQVRIQGGTVQLFLNEKGVGLIPATRLSDGTLRYLCLMAVLCHPSPPPVVCIEEPELALHPDVVPFVGELMIETAQRTQLIVTTHSDALVSALSRTPESVLVGSREESGTVLERLDGDELDEWLERYTLGDLWRMGEIGGTVQ